MLRENTRLRGLLRQAGVRLAPDVPDDVLVTARENGERYTAIAKRFGLRAETVRTRILRVQARRRREERRERIRLSKIQ